MTDKQVKLLELFKEIDTLCKKHDIEYYLAGGSLIGAVRHKGFVPWDDDVDLYMTRDNWLKFIEVCKTDIPEGRILETPETDSKYYNMFGRYVDKTTTAIHNAQTLHDDVAGFVIDILTLDPIPKDKEKYDKYVKDLMLYSDLINPSIVYSYRWDCNKYRYPVFDKMMRIFGKEKVTKYLEKRMFSYSEDECSDYAMRWGGKPFIFPKKWFNEVTFEKFEDVDAEIPTIISPYMTWHYGDEWMYIPPHDEQEGHEAIYSLEHDYHPVREEIHSMIDSKKYLDYLKKRKTKWLRYMKQFHSFEDEKRAFKVESLSLDFNSRFSKQKDTILKLREEKNYSSLFEIFGDYFKEQLAANMIGREDYVNIYRFEKPLYVKIEDEEILETAIETLINVEKISKAMRLMEVIEILEGSISAKLKEFRADILTFREAVVNIEKGEVKACKEKCSALLCKYPNCISFLKLMLYTLKAESIETNKDEIKALVEKGYVLVPGDGDFIRYDADLMLESGDKESALLAYINSFRNTSNGLTRLDITEFVKKNIEEYSKAIKNIAEENLVDAIAFADTLLEIVPFNAEFFGEKCNAIYSLTKDNYNLFVSFNKILLTYLADAEEDNDLIRVYKDFLGKITGNKTIVDEYYQTVTASEYEEYTALIAKFKESIKEQKGELKAWTLKFLADNLISLGRNNEAFEYLCDAIDITKNDLLRFFLIRSFISEIKYYTRGSKLDPNSGSYKTTDKPSIIDEWSHRYPTVLSAVEFYSKIGIIPEDAIQYIDMLGLLNLEVSEENKWTRKKLKTFEKICFKCAKEKYFASDLDSFLEENSDSAEFITLGEREEITDSAEEEN